MNVLLINDSVKEYQLFVDSVNENTLPFVYGSTTTREDFNFFLKDKNIQRIGFVFEIGMNLLGQSFFDSVDYLNGLNVPKLDFLACNTLGYLLWKDFYSKLNGIIRASDNPTGNLKYGGDWTLESTMEDVEKVYFTASIEYYKYLLQALVESTFAFIKNNRIYGSGSNLDNILSNSSTTNFTTLQDITEEQSEAFKAKTPKFLSMSDSTFFVIDTDGELWGKGKGTFMLGKGDNTATPTFINITTLNTFGNAKPVYIHSTSYAVILLMNDGTLWGTVNDYSMRSLIGVPNLNDTNLFQNITEVQSDVFKEKTPIFIHGNSGYSFWSLVLMSDGTLWTTGRNEHGQLGLGNIDTSPTFQQVTQFGATKVVSVTTTRLYGTTIFILEDNTIWACGSNENLLIQSNNRDAKFNTFQNIGTFQSADFQSKTLKDVYTGLRGVTVRMMDGSLWRQGEYDAIRLIGTISSGTSYLFQEFKPQSTDFLSKTPKHFLLAKMVQWLF